MSLKKVCKASDIPEGGMRAFKVDDTAIIVYHLAGGFFATQARCTHVFAPLARGKIVDGCQVQCPLHRARFDIATGEVVEWANFPIGVQLLNAVRKEKALRTFAVKVRGADVLVDVDREAAA